MREVTGVRSRIHCKLMVLLLAMAPALSLAQPTSAPTSRPTSQPTIIPFPNGMRLTVGRGVFQGYNLEDFKILLRIHADYRALWTQAPLLKNNIRQARELSENLSKQLKLYEEEVTLFKKEKIRLFEKWKKDNQLRHECENKPMFGHWIAWAATAVMTAATITFAALWLEVRE